MPQEQGCSKVSATDGDMKLHQAGIYASTVVSTPAPDPIVIDEDASKSSVPFVHLILFMPETVLLHQLYPPPSPPCPCL